MARPSTPIAQPSRLPRHHRVPIDLQDPLDPLAKAIGDALLSHVVEAPAGAGHRFVMDMHDAGPATARRGRCVPEELRRRLNELVAQALEESLSARTAEGKRLRMAIVGRLAHLEMDEGDAGEAGAVGAPQDVPAADDPLLTTAQVAQRLQMSRPYVAMLCDSGKLGEVTVTEGGHRRIRRSAVEAFVAAQASGATDAGSPRQAGIMAGLYGRDDAQYVEAGRRSAVPATQAAGRAGAKSQK